MSSQYKKKAYLAGGRNETSWRNDFKETFAGKLDCFDPCLLPDMPPVEYTNADLQAIEECDIFIGAFFPTNPRGWNLGLEMGFALAQGKPIFLYVPEHEDRDIEMWRSVARIVTTYDGLIFCVNAWFKRREND